MGRLFRPVVIAVAALGILAAGLVAVVARAGRAGETSAPAASGRLGPAPVVSTTSTVPATTTTSTTISPAALRLSGRLDAALAGTAGCLVVTDGPTTLYASQATTPLAPASTQKLLVAAAALSMLGPDFRFVTTVVAPAAPKGGVVNGLWLVGSGDPILATPEFIAFTAPRARVRGYPYTALTSLVGAIKAAGITSVAGGVHGDDSRYDKLRFLPVWPPDYKASQEVGALSALTVNEGLSQWKPVTKLSDDPAATTASELARLMVAQRVSAAAGADGTAPANGVVVAQVASAPLSQIVEVMLSASDNLIAELLVREVDRHAGGTGTTAGGVAAVLARDAALGLPVGDAHLVDGSGLAPSARATCRLLLAALDLAGTPGLEAIGQGLAVAGQTGTLVNRYVGTPLAGKLVGKTGSIADVVGLVGVMSVTRPLHFALLINQPGTYAALLGRIDKVMFALATYPT
jgi:D-alanyl-D-alanine carboxypeptidase/D-alanyl-D-alanine-endopeptidase (penicillin-binding protein 4)